MRPRVKKRGLKSRIKDFKDILPSFLWACKYIDNGVGTIMLWGVNMESIHIHSQGCVQTVSCIHARLLTAGLEWALFCVLATQDKWDLPQVPTLPWEPWFWQTSHHFVQGDSLPPPNPSGPGPRSGPGIPQALMGKSDHLVVCFFLNWSIVIYNVVLVSGVQQSDQSYIIYTYIYSFSDSFPL